MHVDLEHLLDYTEWERGLWRETFLRHGAAALAVATGPHGDGRFDSVGELTRHIFSAELRYAERLLGQPVTDASGIRADDVEALFAFGRRSRAAMRQLLAAMPAADLDVEREFTVIAYVLRMTPRKVILHVVTHEIRHWAQVATLLRMHGFASGFHDFLMSPVYGGSWEKAASAV